MIAQDITSTVCARRDAAQRLFDMHDSNKDKMLSVSDFRDVLGDVGVGVSSDKV